MKFSIENLPEGVIVCDVKQPLSQTQAGQIVKGVEKTLANGKARIIVRFTAESAAGEGGADYLEKSLRQLKALSNKMSGDIKYVVPDPIGAMIFGSFPTLDLALGDILGRSTLSPTEQKDLKDQLKNKNQEVTVLRTEISRLTDKLRELMEMVGKPSTDAELRKSAEHYQLLASKDEAPASSETPPSKTK